MELRFEDTNQEIDNFPTRLQALQDRNAALESEKG